MVVAANLAKEPAAIVPIGGEVRVTRTETSTDSEGRASTRDVTTTEWRVIEHGSDYNSFFVVDETGHVLVDPQHATVKPRSVLDEIVGGGGFSLFAGDGPTGRVRQREQVIAIDDPIYVMGVARVREGEAVLAAKGFERTVPHVDLTQAGT